MALICLLVPYKYNNGFMSGIVIKTLHGCLFCVYSALQDIKQYTERQKLHNNNHVDEVTVQS